MAVLNVRESLKNAQSLQSSLNSIFLSIGNAYYEANKLAKNKTGNGPVALSAAITTEAANKIKQGRTTFLDSLDQLEILVIRATEVLERHAKLQNPETTRKASLAAMTSDGQGAPDPTSDVLEGALGDKPLEPSPESMLLNGEGLLPPAETPVGDLGLTGATPASLNLATAPTSHPVINDPPAPAMPEVDMTGEEIDFSNFDTSFFEDTNFDFAMMMEDN